MTNSDYLEKYKTLRMRRDHGILEVRFQAPDGGPLVWTLDAHQEFAEAFSDIAKDQQIKVVIMTGTGDTFSGPRASRSSFPIVDAQGWERRRFTSMRLATCLLDIPVPIVSCINGPAYRHAEIPLLADVVLAASDAVVEDSAHFSNGLAPGDGVNLLIPLLMGWNRGRYFLLTGGSLDARRLLELGLVNELMSREQLLPRAWELAQDFSRRSLLALRYTRLMLTAPIRQLLHQYLGYGLALEGLSAIGGPSGEES